MRARWLPLKVGGAWNAQLRRIFDGSSGVYAFRRKGATRVEYVGESHTGRGWKTLQRHFQDPGGAFADRSEFTATDASSYECAVWQTSKGEREKKSGDQAALDLQARMIDRYRPRENRDDGKAYEKCPHGTTSRRCAKHHLSPEVAKKIGPRSSPDDDFAFGANATAKEDGGAFDGLINPDDGRYEVRGVLAGAYRGRQDRRAMVRHAIYIRPSGEPATTTLCGAVDEGSLCDVPESGAPSCKRCDMLGRRRADLSGHWPEKNPPPLAPNVAPEKRAENRTPDLFTGRTKLEDGGKGPRRDWKGEAERIARDLAECRASSSRSSASSTPPSKPAPKPDGYGTTDEKGQSSMFKRNPKETGKPVVIGELVKLGYRLPSGARRVLSFASGRVLVAYLGHRLVLVFGPRVTGSSSAASRKEYARTHWGRAGAGDRLDGDVLEGKAPRLGTCTEITYATKKGTDPELVDYWHTFGDVGALGRKKAFIAPALEGATVGGRQLLRLVGGTYTVDAHGIVG